MAYVITDACSTCGLCVLECPIEAIHPGDPIYVIDDTCCEFAECVTVCPEDAIVHEDSIHDADSRPDTDRGVVGRG
jgi:ferredoxin